MKLKTINELKEFDPQPCCGELEVKLIKEEAIKWIKKNIVEIGIKEALKEGRYLMEFMNLTIGDLK